MGPSTAERRRTSRLLALALALAPSVAWAQSPDDVQAAERAFNEAIALMDAGRYREACPKLEASDGLAPASGTLLNLADCYEHVGRFGSAWKAFEDAAARAKASGKYERERVARERAAALVPRLSRLVLAISDAPADLKIQLDGAPVPSATWGTPLVVDAGAHTLVAEAAGRETATLALPPVAVGATVTFQLPPLAVASSAPVTEQPVAPSPPSRLDGQRVGAIVSAGVGVVGLVAGTAFGLHSLARHDESDRYCEGNACQDPRGVSAMNEARTAGDRATVSFIVAGVGLTAASVLWFVRPFSPRQTQTQIGVAPGGVVLRGQF